MADSPEELLGAPGAGIAIALENLFPSLPSEVILPLAGFTASRGEMDLVAVLLWTTAGSVIGALALYWVGALLGRGEVRQRGHQCGHRGGAAGRSGLRGRTAA
ncbi:hypothetical protein [Microbispora sp. NBRC 16548]|uniref:DedA family protein n=1 Tax=Microbispora sp. NBRC 16548 TaxID=3030994 RepID=UPI0025551CF5|nr:hypothetical protein [Microbispora sp. NBRC 16548]